MKADVGSAIAGTVAADVSAPCRIGCSLGEYILNIIQSELMGSRPLSRRKVWKKKKRWFVSIKFSGCAWRKKHFVESIEKSHQHQQNHFVVPTKTIYYIPSRIGNCVNKKKIGQTYFGIGSLFHYLHLLSILSNKLIDRMELYTHY